MPAITATHMRSFGRYLGLTMQIPLLVALILGIAAAIRDGRKTKRDMRCFDAEFLNSCRVATEISRIEYRASEIVLAKCRDGRWGIASRHGWLHLGKGKYIATQWKRHTGQWPYIYH